MHQLIINHLSKSFGPHPILNDISCTINAGEVVAILGSSGSGKSTLLKCINALEKPNRGLVKVNNITLNHDHQKKIPPAILKQLRTQVGMVFQQFNLWRHLTVLQNLTMAPIHVLQQTSAQAIEQAEQLLHNVGLSHKTHCYPSQLSGGQQQRAAIARALMMAPKIMLLDEPTSALDPEMTREVLQTLQQLAAEGMTMLIATHEISFAKQVASQVIFLEHGVIVEQGAAAEILNYPRTQRLQQFLHAAL